MPDIELADTFTNPVYNDSFPDPFVLRFKGEYFAFCTGQAADGRCFGRLWSRDLVTWKPLPGAMQPLATGEPYYWAPEVTYRNGKFYLYYSVGNETVMTIRVAVADAPDREFVDAGIALTSEDFAIDPHIFRDDDGRVFMFYATDFLDYSHVGTGTVVDEMIDPFTLKGEPRPVTRAQFDWQVYDPARKEKGGVRWHTVEGPFVLKRKGIYYEMFSGGNWQNISYGVSFAVSDNIDSDQEWSQYSDGAKIPPIMKTIPGRVTGPGHNSVIRGPNNRDLYCIYHRWENEQRVLAIDRMDFAGGRRMFVLGPTFAQQPGPFKPGLQADLAAVRSHSFLGVASFRLGQIDVGEARITFLLDGEPSATLTMRVEPNLRAVVWSNEFGSKTIDLPIGFDPAVVHDITIEVDNRFAMVMLDNTTFVITWELSSPVSALALTSENSNAAFSAFSITRGFEDRFEADDLDLRGWKVNDPARFVWQDQILRAIGNEETTAQLSREIESGDHELCVNLRFESWKSEKAIVTIGCSSVFVIDPTKRSVDVSNETFPLPTDYSPEQFHQLRFLSIDRKTVIYLDATHLGTIQDIGEDAAIGRLDICIENAGVHFDMVRFTII